MSVMGSFIETELNAYEETYKELETKDKEIERLHSIIKEVREYIEYEDLKSKLIIGLDTKKYTKNILDNVSKILDKVDKEK